MNERIKELAEQAGMTNDKYGMFFAKDYHDEAGVDLEKFAELIIKECIKIALDHDPLWGASVDQDIERLLGIKE